MKREMLQARTSVEEVGRKVAATEGTNTKSITAIEATL